MDHPPTRIILTVVNDLTYDQRMHRICKSLSQNGYSVLLVGRRLKKSRPLTAAPYEQHRLNLIFSKGKLFYIEYAIRLFFFLLSSKFDIVCGIDLDSILSCYYASRLNKKKCVYDAHELFSEVPEVINRPLTKKIWKDVERYACKKIDHCYTVSAGLAVYFNDQYQRKFEVIRNMPALDGDYIEKEAFNQESFILYQGALNEGRGLEQLIDCMKELPYVLKLAGEGDLSSRLRKMVKEKQLEGKVEFLGLKKPAELRNLTRQSAVCVNLLENRGLSYYYSLANKFFDAVHAGIPQVTMNFPEYSKLNSEFEVAILVNDLEPETLTAAILKLMHDKDQYFRLRKNCIEARMEWNWQKEEQKLLSFYRQLQ